VITPAPSQPVKAATPPPVKAEIELREKKAGKVKPVQPAKPVKPAKPSAKELKELKELKAKQQAEEQRLLEEYTENRRNNEQAEKARVRAEVSAATAAEVGRYEDMIRGKIRRNIVMPPDVAESVTSEFKVTLLPGGMVMEVELVKGSGNPAYDNAAERAIYKAQPLPVPANAELQKMFRELRLIIRPEE
jgi:colicin import membrane protein